MLFLLGTNSHFLIELRSCPLKFLTIIKKKRGNMNSFVKANLHNNSYTKNYMPTNSSSNDPLVDFFFICGASRNMPEEDIITIFNEAYQKDSTIALRLLFWARDIEQGLGERRIFRIIINWLNESVLKNLLKEENFINNIVRVDDIVYLANQFVLTKRYELADKIIVFLFELLKNKNIQSIVAKWMPRKKSQYKELVKYMRSNGFINSYSEYRHKIVSLTNVVEQKMSANKWDSIELEKVPSLAMKKYKQAFNRHGILESYVKKVVNEEAKVNAKRLFPYDIVREVLIKYLNILDSTYTNNIYNSEIENLNIQRQLLNEQWKSLKELDDLPKEFQVIPIIDVSGSMLIPKYLPISIALGLGLYMAENNPNKDFRNYFLTFSNYPKFQKIIGSDIVEKVKNALNSDWGMSTNLELAFNCILKKAKNDNVPPEEMPTHILILSDMEFNMSVKNPDNNAYEMIRREYESAGYNMPTVIYWNLNGRIGNVPALASDKHTLLISGASQNVINFVLKKGYEDMMQLILEITENFRYSHIS